MVELTCVSVYLVQNEVDGRRNIFRGRKNEKGGRVFIKQTVAISTQERVLASRKGKGTIMTIKVTLFRCNMSYSNNIYPYTLYFTGFGRQRQRKANKRVLKKIGTYNENRAAQ